MLATCLELSNITYLFHGEVALNRCLLLHPVHGAKRPSPQKVKDSIVSYVVGGRLILVNGLDRFIDFIYCIHLENKIDQYLG